MFFNGVSAGCSAASSYLSVCLFVWLVGLVVDWLDSQSVCWLVGWLVGSLIIWFVIRSLFLVIEFFFFVGFVFCLLVGWLIGQSAG